MTFPIDKRQSGQIPTETGWWYVRRNWSNNAPNGPIFPVWVQFFKNGAVRVNYRMDQDLRGAWHWRHAAFVPPVKEYNGTTFEWFGPVPTVEEK